MFTHILISLIRRWSDTVRRPVAVSMVIRQEPNWVLVSAFRRIVAADTNARLLTKAVGVARVVCTETGCIRFQAFGL